MTSRTIALACLAAVCCVTPALAQAPAAPSAASGDGITLKRFLARRVNPMIGALDADHDGKISKAELSSLSARASASTLAVGERVFDQIDVNHDGALSRAELNAYLTELFNTADANHDGVLSDAEQQALRQGMKGKR
jgi:hypothetical protein